MEGRTKKGGSAEADLLGLVRCCSCSIVQILLFYHEKVVFRMVMVSSTRRKNKEMFFFSAESAERGTLHCNRAVVFVVCLTMLFSSFKVRREWNGQSRSRVSVL